MASLNSIINGTAPKPLYDEVILLFRAGGDNRLSTICQKTGLKRGAVSKRIDKYLKSKRKWKKLKFFWIIKIKGVTFGKCKTGGAVCKDSSTVKQKT